MPCDKAQWVATPDKPVHVVKQASERLWTARSWTLLSDLAVQLNQPVSLNFRTSLGSFGKAWNGRAITGTMRVGFNA